MSLGITFFGTQAFPWEPRSNKRFDSTIQIALFAIMALGITLGVLGSIDVLPHNFVNIGGAIASSAFVVLKIHHSLQKNWFLIALRTKLENNDPQGFEELLQSCTTGEICNRRGERFISDELVGGVYGMRLKNMMLAAFLNQMPAEGQPPGLPQWKSVTDRIENIKDPQIGPDFFELTTHYR